MLVIPGGVAAGVVDYAEDGISADEVPGVDRRAAPLGVARQTLGIDRGHATIGHIGSGSAAIQFALVEVDALFIFGSSAGRRGTRRACSGGYAIACGLCRRIERAVIRDVVVNAHGARVPPVTIASGREESDGREVLAAT